jgi:hypothetical protein
VVISLAMICTVILAAPPRHWAITALLVEIGSAINRSVFLWMH